MSVTSRRVLNRASIGELSRMLGEMAGEYFTPASAGGEDEQTREITVKMKALLEGLQERLAGRARLTERQWAQLCNETIESVATVGDPETKSVTGLTAAQIKQVVTDEMIRDVFATAAKEQTARIRH